MAYQNIKHRGWCPSNDYQVHEVAGPALRKGFEYHPRQQQHRKGHVAFSTILEEPIEAPPVPVAETHDKTTTTESDDQHVNAYQSVDAKADAFIKLEHRRLELARLKSLGLA